MKKKLLLMVLMFSILSGVVYKFGYSESEDLKYKNKNISKANYDEEDSTEIYNKAENNIMGDENSDERSIGNPEKPLNIPTYVKTDNHGLHPRVVYDENNKYGYKWIMAFTPYSWMRDTTENPSIVVSEDGENWFVPEGLTNPIVGTDIPKDTHYSDTDLIDNGKELELWYRQSDKIGRQSRLLRRKSTDCINWSKEEIILDYGTGGYGYGASSVVLKDGEYQLYYRENMGLDKEAYFVKKSKDCKNWSEPVPINFDYGPKWSNFVGWHIEFDYIDGKYYALNMAYPKMKGKGGTLFAFESGDGTNFKNAKRIVKPTERGFDSENIYKSTFIIKNDEIWLYYSGINSIHENYIGLLRGKDFLNLEPVEGTGGSSLYK